MNEIIAYVNYLIEFFRNNQDPNSVPLRFEDLYQYEDEVADRIYDLITYVKNSK